MLTLIFGIWASDPPPPGPGERLKRPSLIGLKVIESLRAVLSILKCLICYALGYYGDILSVQQVTRVMFGKKLDTGDRVVIFKKIYKDIPSYVTARGWKAFIMYRGQPRTCRSCGKVGHFAKDRSSKRKTDEKSSEDQDKPGKTKSDEKSTGSQDVPVNMEITEPSVILTHEQVIKGQLKR